MLKPVFASVIIPTFNQAAYLPAALDSLLAQTDRDWEAIVVNDGSTDNTAEIADGYAQRDSRIHCIHQSNGGVASALNTGLASAHGEWIHWLSSDDMFEPHKLATNRHWIEQHPDTKFFFSYFTLLRDATGVSEKRDLWGPLPVPLHQLLTLFYRNYVSGISICVSRHAWEAVGFFDESLRYAQDYDQWLRLLQKNQGRLIPEWLVISRNHAEQGSETFPDACYFDTAKAAIRFINRHTFPELVPWASLIDPEIARKAVLYALEVACERTAFLYCLGPQPALVLRILEWVFSTDCKHPELKSMVRDRIAAMSFVEGDDDWAWMWRQLALLAHGGSSHIACSPIQPEQLALREYCARKLGSTSSPQTLSEYLCKFDGIDPEGECSTLMANGRIVFLLESISGRGEIGIAANNLAKRGFRPLILIDDRADQGAAWEWGGLVPVVRVTSFDQNTLPWLGEVELAVLISGMAPPVWLGAISCMGLSECDCLAAAIESRVLDRLGHGEKRQIRPVVFLERVLWGGGAERVVYDIVKHLDRQRYRPVVVTLFDEHTAGPVWPSDVVFHNASHLVSANEKNSSEQIPAIANKVIHRIRLAYRQALSQSVRERLGLGIFLLTIRNLGRRMAKGMGKPVAYLDQMKPITSCALHENRGGLDFDFINAMTHHNPPAVGLARVIRELGGGVPVVTVMEEAAITAWLAQAESRFPYVASLHTFESRCMEDIYPNTQRYKAERFLLSVSGRYAARVVFPSRGCCDDFVLNFEESDSRPARIWNPVDCAKVHRLANCSQEATEMWMERSTGFRMVHVGRLDPQKNHDLLLSVCAELKKRKRAFSLAIIGEGHARADIEKRIEELGLSGSVALVGEQANPFSWMAAADALLLTSRFEAFALVLVEAMVCGTPVISVDCPAGPGEVLNGGEFGLLVPNDNPAALADAVERLMDDPMLAQGLSEQGYERAKVFDVKTIVPQWESLLDTMVRESASVKHQKGIEACNAK